jgi:hypothetical protein
VSILAWISTAGAGMLQFSKQQTGRIFYKWVPGGGRQFPISDVKDIFAGLNFYAQETLGSKKSNNNTDSICNDKG